MEPRFVFKPDLEGKYGLYDNRQEAWLSECIYDDVKKPVSKRGTSILRVFWNKLVCIGGKWGVFSLHPNVLAIKIPCEYDEIEYDCWAEIKGWLLKKDGYWGVFDISKKEQIIPCEYDEVESAPSAWLLKKDGYWGLYDIKKHMITIPCDYDKLIVTEHECKALKGAEWHTIIR